MPRLRVTVAVVGDLGRSPRMLYHARALADSGADVDLVGTVEHALPADIARRVRVRALPPSAGAARHQLPHAAFLGIAAWNAARHATTLFAALGRPDALLVQCPPAIPMLGVALAAARARGARLVVDWHNLGWAMLALRVGARHPAVALARAWEHGLGRRADGHLCVSHALAAALARDAGIKAAVFHDRPAAAFAPLDPDARHAVRNALVRRLALPADAALVVSPTSWTADEDYALLADAAVALDARPGPPVAIVVTGDGALRAEWDARFAALALRRVHLRTCWLDAEEYPRALAAADVGLSLHRSASGLDLPMKVMDCFGAGLPVVALDYAPCLAEAVRDGENGVLFRTPAALAERLTALLDGDAPLLARLRRGVAAEQRVRWDDAWRSTVLPLLGA